MSPTRHPTGIRPSLHMASIPMVRVVFSQWTTDATLLSDSPSRNLYTWDSSTGAARSFALTSVHDHRKALFFSELPPSRLVIKIF